MAKTTGLSGAGSLFAGIRPYAEASDVPAEDRVQRLPLEEVRPDRGQPRRLLPPDLTAALHAGELPPLIILDRLAERAAGDPGLAATLESLQDLAADIAANGLISPITVREAENGAVHYIIETGERRWWAHWWLAREGKDEYRRIRALVVPSRSTRVRQLSENLKRAELTAVEVALGLAALILEIEGENVPAQPESGALLPAALRELVERRLKHGVWPEVVERLGYSRSHWQHYLNLLHLGDEALELAHRRQLSEWALRDVARLDDPAMQAAAIEAMSASSPLPRLDAEAGEEVAAAPESAKEEAPVSRPAWLRRVRRLQQQFSWSSQAGLDELRQAFGQEDGREALTALRDQIGRLLAALEEA